MIVAPGVAHESLAAREGERESNTTNVTIAADTQCACADRKTTPLYSPETIQCKLVQPSHINNSYSIRNYCRLGCPCYVVACMQSKF